MTNDPILSTFGVFIHRVLIFSVLWLATAALLLYYYLGAHMTLHDWWALFLQVTGSECPPAVWHGLVFVAIASLLPVLTVFVAVGSWWRGQGVQSLRGTPER